MDTNHVWRKPLVRWDSRHDSINKIEGNNSLYTFLHMKVKQHVALHCFAQFGWRAYPSRFVRDWAQPRQFIGHKARHQENQGA